LLFRLLLLCLLAGLAVRLLSRLKLRCLALFRKASLFRDTCSLGVGFLSRLFRGDFLRGRCRLRWGNLRLRFGLRDRFGRRRAAGRDHARLDAQTLIHGL